MGKKKVLFYDLDGTLADTRRDIAEAGNHMRVQMGLSVLSYEDIYFFVGKGIQWLIEGVLESTDPKRVEKGFQIYREYYAKHMLDNTALYPQAGEVLERFSDVAQVVVTNKPDPYSTEILEALGVLSFFKEVIPGNGRFPKKPSIEAIQHWMKEVGASKEEALFLGDSTVDFETAQAAEIECVLFSHGFMPPEHLESLAPQYLIPDFGTFLELAKEKDW